MPLRSGSEPQCTRLGPAEQGSSSCSDVSLSGPQRVDEQPARLSLELPMDGLRSTFKREILQGRKSWPNERQARLDAFRWLNRYNTRRRHSSLGHRSPIAYETALATQPTTLVPAA
ncbi:integrase core domain-containing protein [Streptomyces sp. NPDC059985]|uniref:integrase core domain-containing protein n=1 Tax=Streptomyces sp. NPDC059985 TaxID=3347025 RepID=UPI0036CA7234